MGLIPDGELAAMRATVAPLANARLKRITGPGAPDRNGDPTTGADLWTGDAPCFFERVRHDEVSSGQQVPVRNDYITVLEGDVPVVEVAGPDWQASVLEIEDRRSGTPVTLRFNVRAMEREAFGLLDSVRVQLDEITS